MNGLWYIISLCNDVGMMQSCKFLPEYSSHKQQAGPNNRHFHIHARFSISLMKEVSDSASF